MSRSSQPPNSSASRAAAMIGSSRCRCFRRGWFRHGTSSSIRAQVFARRMTLPENASGCRSTPKPPRSGRAGTCGISSASILPRSDGCKARSNGRAPMASRTRRRCCARSRSSRTQAASRWRRCCAGRDRCADRLPQAESFGRHPDVARLFPDHRALERELYRNSKIFPIMHLITMRRDLYERHPWLGHELLQRVRRIQTPCARAHAFMPARSP